MAVTFFVVLFGLTICSVAARPAVSISAQFNRIRFCFKAADYGPSATCQYVSYDYGVFEAFIDYRIDEFAGNGSLHISPALMDFDPVLLWARPPGSCPYLPKSRYDALSILMSVLLLSAGDIQ